MHKVYRALGIRHHRLEQISSLQHEVAMRRERLVPGKHDMSALVIALKEAEINSKAIPVHIYQCQTETQQLKDKN